MQKRTIVKNLGDCFAKGLPKLSKRHLKAAAERRRSFGNVCAWVGLSLGEQGRALEESSPFLVLVTSQTRQKTGGRRTPLSCQRSHWGKTPFKALKIWRVPFWLLASLAGGAARLLVIIGHADAFSPEDGEEQR
jgi:hypothetical protein